MNENIVLVIIIIISIIFFSASLGYIIINRGDNQIIELSFKSLLIPVVVVFGLLFLNFLKPINNRQTEIVFSLTDKPFLITSLVTDPMDHGSLYYGASNIMVFYSKLGNHIDLSKVENRLEIVESELVHLLHKRYNVHWLIHLSNKGQYFDGNASSISPKDAGREKKTISKGIIHSSFPKTHIIQKIDEDIAFSLPQETEVKSTGEGSTRVLQFENKHVVITFEIREFAQAELSESYGKTNMLLKQRLGESYHQFKGARMFGNKINVNISPKRLRRNNPETIIQMAWAEEMVNYLTASMDWNLVLEKVVNLNNSELLEKLGSTEK